MISKSRLLKDIDIIAANRGFSHRKLEFISSIDEKKHKLFKYEGQYSCLLTLQNAVLVSSAPDATVGPSSAQAIFSFAYKAHMKTKSIGTLNRYTLQYLCDTSYDLLNSTKEGIVLRGGFPPDPSTCSHLLQIIRQKVMGTYNLSSDSFNIIYESRPLTALFPLFPQSPLITSATTRMNSFWSSVYPSPRSLLFSLSFQQITHRHHLAFLAGLVWWPLHWLPSGRLQRFIRILRMKSSLSLSP